MPPSPSPATLTERERRARVDELGRLAERYSRSLKRDLDRLKQLKNEIASWAADAPAERGASYDGLRYTAQVSPRALERRIGDMAKVAEAMGSEEFWKRCSLALQALDAYVPDAAARGLVTETRTGARSVTAVARAAKPAREKTRKEASGLVD